ncbi:MAG: complexin-2 [Candidatus Ornithomonoglobus sp.]
MKNIQISYELFRKLLLYHLSETYDYAEDIERGLQNKLDAMVRREYYTKYKTAPTMQEAEKYRIKYLDTVGMHKDFRY